jgi:hypothetical protein
MKDSRKQLSVTELSRLLVTIAEQRLGVCFRFRLMGEMWYPNFVRVLKVTDKGALLNDETKNKIISIADLSSVIQFELDASLHNYEPHFHYEVTARQF